MWPVVSLVVAVERLLVSTGAESRGLVFPERNAARAGVQCHPPQFPGSLGPRPLVSHTPTSLDWAREHVVIIWALKCN